MKIAMFKDVVVPLLGMTQTVLVMISTPVDSFNFFTKLMDIKNDRTGAPLFLRVQMRLACDRCIVAERAHLCKHRMKFLPPWKSDEKQDYMRMILQDSTETMARENMGVIMDSGQSVFGKRFIERWLELPRYNPEYLFRADVVVIAVDPNGSNAKTASEMAIVSTALTWNLRVVCFQTVPSLSSSGLISFLSDEPTVNMYWARKSRTKDSPVCSSCLPSKKSSKSPGNTCLVKNENARGK